MKVVCKCGKEMKNDRTGMVWLTKLESGHPYQLWSCDRMLCQSCENVAYRLGNQPMSAHHEKGFLANVHAARSVGILVEEP